MKDTGTIAVFYKYQDDTRSTFVAKVRDLYRKHCPKFPDDFEQRQQHFGEIVLASNLFGNLEERIEVLEKDIQESYSSHKSKLEKVSMSLGNLLIHPLYDWECVVRGPKELEKRRNLI